MWKVVALTRKSTFLFMAFSLLWSTRDLRVPRQNTPEFSDAVIFRVKGTGPATQGGQASEEGEVIEYLLYR